MDVSESYLYSIPYLILLSFLFFLYYKESQNNSILKPRTIQLIAMFSLLLFIGLRGFVYSDWASYYPTFNEMPTFWDGDILTFINDSRFETGFVIYSIIIKSIFPDYFVWVFINTLIDLWILDLIFRRYSKSFILACIVFFVMNGILIEFNLYRNSKAIMLFLLSIRFLEEKKFIPYLLINLLGATFHSSALILIPLYFVFTRSISNKVAWIIFILGNIIFLFQIKWFQLILEPLFNILNFINLRDSFSNYTEAPSLFSISIGYIERIITFVVFITYKDRLIQANKSNLIFYNMYLLYIISVLYLFEVQVFVERFSYIFIFSYWVLYPNVLNLVENKRVKRYFIFAIIIFSYLRVMTANRSVLAKYDNQIFGIEDYDQRDVIFKRDSDLNYEE